MPADSRMPRVRFEAIVDCLEPYPDGDVIGHSREGRPIRAHRIGQGPLKVNLVGGCHADEPVGPRLLRQLVRFLCSAEGSVLRAGATWSIVPHLNPDGAAVNAPWQTPEPDAYDPVKFLKHRVRELPGDDIEFGFPRSATDIDARPENRAAHSFWQEEAPYDMHGSLHGMSVGSGPYFLVERTWWPRFAAAAEGLAAAVRDSGFALHDVERYGEKGFHRLAPGFCSRPDSRSMQQHFLALDDADTAHRFRPSSMEAVRALGGDPLTLVTEMPLFLTPGVGVELGPPDPALHRWREAVTAWELKLREAPADGDRDRSVREAMAREGFVPMGVRDQMRFQWAFLSAGLDAVGQRLPSE